MNIGIEYYYEGFSLLGLSSGSNDRSDCMACTPCSQFFSFTCFVLFSYCLVNRPPPTHIFHIRFYFFDLLVSTFCFAIYVSHYLHYASPAATRRQRRFCSDMSANGSRRSRHGRRQHFKGTTQGVRLQCDVIPPKMSYIRKIQPVTGNFTGYRLTGYHFTTLHNTQSVCCHCTGCDCFKSSYNLLKALNFIC